MLRYSAGEQYGAHYDALLERPESPRVATVLMYLGAGAGLVGGETAFPKVPTSPVTVLIASLLLMSAGSMLWACIQGSLT